MSSRILLLAGLLLFAPALASAKVLLSTDEGLALAFPGCTIERRTVFLSAAEQAEASRLAQAEVTSALVHQYVATCGGRLAGTAYFDAHRVRTLPEALMVVIDARGRVQRLEVLSFSEPEDYLPKAAWYAQFVGRELDQALALKHDIRPIAGATLTARATTEAVRRVLALHRVVTASAP